MAVRRALGLYTSRLAALAEAKRTPEDKADKRKSKAATVRTFAAEPLGESPAYTIVPDIDFIPMPCTMSLPEALRYFSHSDSARMGSRHIALALYRIFEPLFIEFPRFMILRVDTVMFYSFLYAIRDCRLSARFFIVRMNYLLSFIFSKYSFIRISKEETKRPYSSSVMCSMSGFPTTKTLIPSGFLLTSISSNLITSFLIYSLGDTPKVSCFSDGYTPRKN